MGHLSLLLVVGAFLVSGILLYNANNSATAAGDRVWEHQRHVVARDGAATGMARSVRTLTENLNGDWSLLPASLNLLADEPYDGGTYTVKAFSNQCSILNSTSQSKFLTRYPGVSPSTDLIEVRATGTNTVLATDSDTHQSHQIVACYIQADWSNPIPPSFQYSFISNEFFDFKGGPEIQAYLDGEGNVHSNDGMYLGPKVVIDGHATMVETGISQTKTDDVASFGYGPSVPMRQFDPETFRSSNNIPIAADGTGPLSTTDYKYSPSSVTIGGNTTFSPPGGGTREDDPWIWFVDGDLTISGNAHLRLPQWTTVVVTGKLNVQAGANVTVTGQTPKSYCGCSRPSDEQMREWVGTQLLGGDHSPLAWYVDGDGDRVSAPSPDDDNVIDDVVLGGGGALVGNIYTNGDYILNGGGGGMNLVGNVVAYGDIRGNGGGNGNNFWFLEVGQQNIIPGVLLPGKQIVRLAYAEWTDPVLDN